MTAVIDDGREEERVVNDVVQKFVIHLLDAHAGPHGVKAQLKVAIREAGASGRIPANAEFRMLPSIAPKEPRRPLASTSN